MSMDCETIVKPETPSLCFEIQSDVLNSTHYEEKHNSLDIPSDVTNSTSYEEEHNSLEILSDVPNSTSSEEKPNRFEIHPDVTNSNSNLTNSAGAASPKVRKKMRSYNVMDCEAILETCSKSLNMFPCASDPSKPATPPIFHPQIRRKTRKPKIRVSRFAQNLYRIANDGIALKWTDDGLGITIEERIYEEHVDVLYPGFAQVATCHNLRRMLREYGFDYDVLRRKKFGLMLEYRHPLFYKGADQAELIQIQKVKFDSDKPYKEPVGNIIRDVLFGGSPRSDYLFSSGDLTPRNDFKNKRTGFVRTKYTEKKRFGRLARDSVYICIDTDECDSSFSDLSRPNCKLSDLRIDDKMKLLHTIGKNELDTPDFVNLMLRQFEGCDDGMKLGTWEKTMQNVEDLVSGNFETCGLNIPVPFEKL